MKVSKQGSTLAGIMDAFSISVSLGLQHGVPLATYVRKYTNMRFEPAGITDDADLRIATSLVDYIFRRLAVDYLPLDERAELGVLSTSERMQPTLPGVEETATQSSGVVDAIDPVVATVLDGSAAYTGARPASVPLAVPEPADPAGRSSSLSPAPSRGMRRIATSAVTPCSGPGRATYARAAVPPAAAHSVSVDLRRVRPWLSPVAQTGLKGSMVGVTLTGRHPRSSRSVHWFADYVYGTISTLVAIAGLTFETNPGALTTAGVVVVGAVAIWLAHTLSRLVTTRSWNQLTVKRSDVRAELFGSWPILAAALPSTVIFTLAGLHLWTVSTAFVLADVVGVLALAVVGVGTVGGRERPLTRRILYVVSLVAVGVMIVLLESVVHLL